MGGDIKGDKLNGDEVFDGDYDGSFHVYVDVLAIL